MWTKLDDGLGSHRKLLRAARLIKAPDGFGRALGAFAGSLLHANRYLTDGYVPPDAEELLGTARATTEALVTVGLWVPDPDRGGFWIHDFHQWNPTAAQVRARQERDRIRKRSRQGYQPDGDGNPPGLPMDSERNPSGIHAEGAGSSSRAVPGPARPGPVHPQTPSHAKGLRLTRADQRAALRAIGPAPATWRDACPHTPTCATPSACDLLAARDRAPKTAAEQQAVPS